MDAPASEATRSLLPVTASPSPTPVAGDADADADVAGVVAAV